MAVTDRARRRATAALHLSLAPLLLLEWALGMAFHAIDYGAVREAWFSWHRTVGILLLPLLLAALLIRPQSPSQGRAERLFRLLRTSLYLVSLMMILTGLLAVSAYRDLGSTMTLAGGIPFPLIPGVSSAVGDSAEEWHKLPLFVVLLAMALIGGIGLRLRPLSGG